MGVLLAFAAIGGEEVEQRGPHCGVRVTTTGSGMPRAKMSGPAGCGRPEAGCLAQRSSRCRRKAKLSGEVGRRRLLALRRLGQQQARLEVGEPRCHDEVIGSQFKTIAARLLDKREVLLGQRQHRDAVKIDLLAACEFEQQVQRTGKSVDVDDQRRLGLACLDARRLFEIKLLRHVVRDSRAPFGPAATVATSCRHRKHAVEPRAGVHRIERLGQVPDALKRRFRPPAAQAGHRRRHLGDLPHLVQIAVAVERHVAPGRERRLRTLRIDPASAFIDRSSDMTRPR